MVICEEWAKKDYQQNWGQIPYRKRKRGMGAKDKVSNRNKKYGKDGWLNKKELRR